jgi:hypothetical protein
VAPPGLKPLPDQQPAPLVLVQVELLDGFRLSMTEQVDEGVTHKRLMLVTVEFAGTLRVMER